MSLNRNVEHGLTMARMGSRIIAQGNQQRPTMQPAQFNAQPGQWGITCYNCGNQGHLARNCPRGRNQNQRGHTRGRGGFQRGRGYAQIEGGQNNQNYNFRPFNRGGRGNRGNYRGRGNYPAQNQAYQNQRYPNFYGIPRTNPFLYTPFYPTGQGGPNWFFMNPQMADNRQPNNVQTPTPSVTIPEN